MSGRVFLDSNVLLYADDADSGEKQSRAQSVILEALESREGVISTQVLQEYFVNATRKLKLEAARAQERVETYLGFEVIQISPEHILAAIDLHRLRSISFWDALIATTASHAGCERLLSEDFQHGIKLSGVRVENPFLERPSRE